MVDSVISEISRLRVQSLYPGIQPLAFRILDDINSATGKRFNVTDAYRSMDAQLNIYHLGRELQGGRWVITDASKIVTNAKPGLSWHNYGLSLDGAWAGDDPYLAKEQKSNRNLLWQTYGKIGKAYGFRWGGDFHLINGVNDLPHLELTYGLTIEQALELYEHGGLKGVWTFIDKLRGIV